MAPRPDNTKPLQLVEEFQATSNLVARKAQFQHQCRPIGARTLPNILEHIGNTPLVRLNKIPASFGIKCQVLAKCEFYGPGGSHKDRIALRMIEDAERAGKLLPGGTIIEPTSGNTGIGIAIVAAVKGYKCIFTMTDKNSQEKVETLAALGAKIIKTNSSLPMDHPDAYIPLARRLQKETPNSIMLDQYSNPGNPGAHYNSTGVEILTQCNGQVDMIVAGAGTGGAISGLARRMKEANKDCLVIGVDPEGSLLAEPQTINKSHLKSWEVEGIGHRNFTPGNLDQSLIDKWYKSNDLEGLEMSRRLIAEEGLLAGGSAGAAVSCALKAIQDAGLSEHHKCVILLPDSIRNYMTKFLTKNWMLEKNFVPESILENPHNYSWWDTKVEDLPLNGNSPAINCTQTIKEASAILHKHKLPHIPVLDDDGCIQGLVIVDDLVSKMIDLRIEGTHPVTAIMTTRYKKVSSDTSLAKLAHVLRGGHCAAVIGQDNQFKGIVTQLDLTAFIFENESH